MRDDTGTAAIVPYRRGWRAPWRRQWGGFADGHTKLSHLARRIERELLEEFVVDTPLKARRVRTAARYSALAEATLQGVGSDPKCTRRAATALAAAAHRELAALEAVGARRDAAEPDVAALLAGMRTESNGGH